jgi:hypothetical protein
VAQTAPARPKINTKVTQAAPGEASRRPVGGGTEGRSARGLARVAGDPRRSSRDPGRVVVELDHGVTVYPPGVEGKPWWAVWVENGRRRYRQGATEEKLAAKLEKITERLEADAPEMERPGADLIAYYLSPDRLPADKGGPASTRTPSAGSASGSPSP